MTDKPTFVYVIESTPEKVWHALTDADLTAEYWGRSNVSDWQVGSTWEHQRTDGTGVADGVGTVVESVEPRRLVLTWEAPGGGVVQPEISYRDRACPSANTMGDAAMMRGAYVTFSTGVGVGVMLDGQPSDRDAATGVLR